MSIFSLYFLPSYHFFNNKSIEIIYNFFERNDIAPIYYPLNINSHIIISFLPFVVLSTLNMKYRTTLSESKKLNASGLLQRATSNHITADKILYDHAIQMVSDIFLLVNK